MIFQTSLLIKIPVCLKDVDSYAQLRFSDRLTPFSSMPSWYFHETKDVNDHQLLFPLIDFRFFAGKIIIVSVILWDLHISHNKSWQDRKFAYQHIELWQQRAWEARSTKRPNAGWTKVTKVTATSVITIVVLSFRMRIACMKKQNLTNSANRRY